MQSTPDLAVSVEQLHAHFDLEKNDIEGEHAHRKRKTESGESHEVKFASNKVFYPSLSDEWM